MIQGKVNFHSAKHSNRWNVYKFLKTVLLHKTVLKLRHARPWRSLTLPAAPTGAALVLSPRRSAATQITTRKMVIWPTLGSFSPSTKNGLNYGWGFDQWKTISPKGKNGLPLWSFSCRPFSAKSQILLLKPLLTGHWKLNLSKPAYYP